MIRHTVHFTGNVQGVGFRYTTRRIAQHHEVAGFVQNLPDGRVLLVAEGQPEKVQAFIADVHDAFSRYIRRHETDTSPATGEFGPPAPGNLDIRY